MNAITTKHATQNLEQLVEQVIFDVEPTILCNEDGKKAVLMGFVVEVGIQ
jgi:antitoxin YefM